jgi:glutamate mutase epsilon subunit
MRKALELKDFYLGGAPNIQEAKELIEKNHLSDDIEFSSLIKARESVNKIQSREVNISLLSNTKKTLKIIADIKIPSIFNISADIETITKSKEEFISKVCVEF